jgi:hypothetical protein
MISRGFRSFGRTLALATVTVLALQGCSWLGLDEDEGPKQLQISREDYAGPTGSRAAASPAAGVAVNSFLWRAALDTVGFLPVLSADPFGGVILTDWHSPTGAANERLKVNIYILDAALRADGIKATVFRQLLDQRGTWLDAPVAPETASQLEDSILTRARQLRQQTAAQR